MEEKNKNKFLKSFSKLPLRIQDFLASDKMGVIIEDALNLGKVSSGKFSSVMDIITKILFFQLRREQFKNELEKRINISPAAAQIVNKVIEEKIFKMFGKELDQYKLQPLEQRIPQKIEIKKPIGPSESPKIKPVIPAATKEKTEQTITEQIPSEQIIPEYSFPEPSKITVEKPVSKIEELKKVVTPKISSNQQDKIREKLLAAMQKRNGPPKIVEEMKKVFLKKPSPKEKKEPLRKKSIGEVASSEILSGEGKRFKDEETFIKTEKEKPYILDVKLKEEKEKKEKSPATKEPIPYKKYRKKSPFGEA